MRERPTPIAAGPKPIYQSLFLPILMDSRSKIFRRRLIVWVVFRREMQKLRNFRDVDFLRLGDLPTPEQWPL